MKFLFFCIALTALLTGCVSTPVRPAPPLILPELAAPEAQQRQRAKAFAELTAKVNVRGIGMFLSAVRNNDIKVDDLLSRIEAMGFNRIYCYLSSETQLDDFFSAFLTSCAKRGIPVEIVLNQRDFYRRSTGNRMLRWLLPDYMHLEDAVKAVSSFNSGLPEGVSVSGITVIAEPHRLTVTNPDLPHDSLYYWSEKSFGAGLDNAMLMDETLKMYKRMVADNPALPITIGVADFYHELASEGKIPSGRIGDFYAVSPRVLLLNYANKPSKAVSALSNELAVLPEKGCVLVGINLAGHTSVDAGALRRRDWNDLMRGMGYILERYRSYNSFDGFVLAPFSALEFIRMERD